MGDGRVQSLPYTRVHDPPNEPLSTIPDSDFVASSGAVGYDHPSKFSTSGFDGTVDSTIGVES
jgi:hypothetical protein